MKSMSNIGVQMVSSRLPPKQRPKPCQTKSGKGSPRYKKAARTGGYEEVQISSCQRSALRKTKALNRFRGRIGSTPARFSVHITVRGNRPFSFANFAKET